MGEPSFDLRTIAVLIVAVALNSSTAGCRLRKALTRDEAAPQLQTSPFMAERKMLHLTTGGGIGRGPFLGRCEEIDWSPHSFTDIVTENWQKLIAAGYLRAENHTIRLTPFSSEQVECIAVLTDAGREATRTQGWISEGPDWRIPVAKRSLVAVTGITQPGENAAYVEFTWKWAAFNPVLSGDEPIQAGHATFTLFDDGWRLTGAN